MVNNSPHDNTLITINGNPNLLVAYWTGVPIYHLDYIFQMQGSIEFKLIGNFMEHLSLPPVNF